MRCAGFFEECVEAFEGDRQVCAAFGGGEVVDLVHDHGGDAREVLRAALVSMR